MYVTACYNLASASTIKNLDFLHGHNELNPRAKYGTSLCKNMGILHDSNLSHGINAWEVKSLPSHFSHGIN
jgi:hypothetical protein